MFPIRRFSSFISRISLTVILVTTTLFFIFGLTKYLVKTDDHRFVLAGRNSFANHDHHYHKSHHADRRV